MKWNETQKVYIMTVDLIFDSLHPDEAPDVVQMLCSWLFFAAERFWLTELGCQRKLRSTSAPKGTIGLERVFKILARSMGQTNQLHMGMD